MRTAIDELKQSLLGVRVRDNGYRPTHKDGRYDAVRLTESAKIQAQIDITRLGFRGEPATREEGNTLQERLNGLAEAVAAQLRQEFDLSERQLHVGDVGSIPVRVTGGRAEFAHTFDVNLDPSVAERVTPLIVDRLQAVARSQQRGR